MSIDEVGRQLRSMAGTFPGRAALYAAGLLPETAPTPAVAAPPVQRPLLGIGPRRAVKPPEAPRAELEAGRWKFQCPARDVDQGKRCSLLEGHAGEHSCSGRPFRTSRESAEERLGDVDLAVPNPDAKKPAVDALKTETPPGCCAGCDEPLKKPGKQFLCGDPECLGVYRAAWFAERNAARARSLQRKTEASAEVAP